MSFPDETPPPVPETKPPSGETTGFRHAPEGPWPSVLIPAALSGFAGKIDPARFALAYSQAQGVWSSRDLAEVGIQALALLDSFPSDRDVVAIATAFYERAKLARGLLDVRAAADALLVWAEQLASLAAGLVWPNALAPQGKAAIEHVAAAARTLRNVRSVVTPAAERPERTPLRGATREPAPIIPIRPHVPHQPQMPPWRELEAWLTERMGAPSPRAIDLDRRQREVLASKGHRVDGFGFGFDVNPRCRSCGVTALRASSRCPGPMLADLRVGRELLPIRPKLDIAHGRLTPIVYAATPDILEEALQVQFECCQCALALPDPDGLFHFCRICERLACSEACWDAHAAASHFHGSAFPKGKP